MKIYQITLKKVATGFVFGSDQKDELVDKMEDMARSFKFSDISFLTIEI